MRRLGRDARARAARAPSGSGRASRPPGPWRSGGRARAGSRAVRRARGSPGRCAPAARGRDRWRRVSASRRSGRTARRSARRRRRARRVACRGRGGRRARSLAASQPQLRRSVQSDRPVGRREDEPAAGEVRAHQVGQHRLRSGIERGGRLIEQPDRPRHRDQRARATAAAAARPKGRPRAGERARPGRRRQARLSPVRQCRRENRPRSRGSPRTDSDGFNASWWPR